ncbi:hypothetical protein FGO68_gene7741 [Halteria grandinella]|uniref:Uncharacterized protein n=1 Tax=Halteria grandinella TaxID=5974 RepID=A0A8J8SUL8_HALGN|nr:hypothetical protein FGO68_gene7741 [Halteria grandinella]
MTSWTWRLGTWCRLRQICASSATSSLMRKARQSLFLRIRILDWLNCVKNTTEFLNSSVCGTTGSSS